MSLLILLFLAHGGPDTSTPEQHKHAPPWKDRMGTSTVQEVETAFSLAGEEEATGPEGLPEDAATEGITRDEEWKPREPA